MALSRWRVGPMIIATFAFLLPSVANADSPPVYDGAMTFPAITEPTGPEEFTWRVVLREGQVLEQLDDRTAVVIYPEEQRMALSISATAAHDVDGTNVPTSLAVSDPDLITLTVHHHDGNPLAAGAPFDYPILAGSGWEGGFQTVVISGPPDESGRQIGDEEREREKRRSKQIRQARQSCVVPKLKGQTFEVAKRRLKAAGCRVGTLMVRKGRQKGRARVIGQSPKPGVVMSLGSTVDLSVRRVDRA